MATARLASSWPMMSRLSSHDLSGCQFLHDLPPRAFPTVIWSLVNTQMDAATSMPSRRFLRLKGWCCAPEHAPPPGRNCRRSRWHIRRRPGRSPRRCRSKPAVCFYRHNQHAFQLSDGAVTAPFLAARFDRGRVQIAAALGQLFPQSARTGKRRPRRLQNRRSPFLHRAGEPFWRWI